VPLLHAVVLGVVQGLTEFLPVSSSGHLILTRWLFGWGTGDGGIDKAFDVAVHVGTLLGATGFLRVDLVRLGRAAWSSLRDRRIGSSPADRLPWMLLVATVPAAVTGALLESTIAARLGAPWLVALMLIAGSVLLWGADRLPERSGFMELTLRHTTVIGVAQALALQPGVSRSGATLAAARALGYDRDAAARFSFLLSLPLIAGAGLYEAIKLLGGENLPSGIGAALLVGVATAAATSVAAVWGVLAIVRRRSFLPFVVYRVVVGVVVLALLASPLR
jgi:undecaprenyl-diphosphatase